MADASVTIGPLRMTDWPAVSQIYEEGIATGVATLEAAAPEWPAWDGAHRRDCRLVARLGAEVVGWAALAPYSGRDVYRGVAWESVYVAAAVRRAGIGRLLLDAVVIASEAAGVWTLLAGIHPENEPSLVLHERAGFRVVGRHAGLGGDPGGRWRDVVVLERRSATVGT